MHRPGAYRQWDEADELAGSAYDQPEELLHVRTTGRCASTLRFGNGRNSNLYLERS
jgi:hypothetical protein